MATGLRLAVGNTASSGLLSRTASLHFTGLYINLGLIDFFNTNDDDLYYLLFYNKRSVIFIQEEYSESERRAKTPIIANITLEIGI